MKKLALFTFILIALAACTDNTPEYTLSGQYGTGNDTLLIFGMDNRHDRIDTLHTDENGEFEYTLATDTVVPLILLLPDGQQAPIFAEPHINATTTHDSLQTERIRITGGKAQELYNEVSSQIATLKRKSQITSVIDTFIKRNPYSDVNIILLQQHLINTPSPKNNIIRDRIARLGGTLQDNSYIARYKKIVNQKQSNILYRSLPEFEFITADSSKVSSDSYRNKYLLITFWASWDSAGLKEVCNLHNIDVIKDTAYFSTLNISLDYDTATWNNTLRTNGIIGDNLCDTKMWDNDIVKNFNIEKLPFNILVNPYQRITKFNISHSELQETGDSIIHKYKEEKIRREAEIKRRKERNK